LIHQFPLKALNGLQLAKELNLNIYDVWVDENFIYINSELSDDVVSEKLKNHKPMQPKPLSITEKLERAGIDVDELRVALGL
jgi:hypothetical protein